MKAQEAFFTLRPESWAKTSIRERLALLRQLQHNMLQYAEEMASAEGTMKNSIVGAGAYSRGFNLFGTVGQMGSIVETTIELYESLTRGGMPQALEITQVHDEIYDVKVFPQTGKERLMTGRQHGHLRVKGKPKQVNPMQKPAGVIAVLGAGNYTSSLEMTKALFWENKAVIHRPHHLNAASDAVWQKIFAPLVEIGALAYCDADQGRDLTTLGGLIAIYFTGGTETAKAIMAATKTPLVFLSPYLTWGGNEDGKEFVSGNGNFGNALNFENVEKSILYDQFVSPADMVLTNKESMERLIMANMGYVVQPTWMNLVRLMTVALTNNFRN